MGSCKKEGNTACQGMLVGGAERSPEMAVSRKKDFRLYTDGKTRSEGKKGKDGGYVPRARSGKRNSGRKCGNSVSGGAAHLGPYEKNGGSKRK